MKKKLLLIALPAFMVLAGCSNHPIKPVAEKEDLSGMMREDTVAHEDIFGSVDLNVKRLGEPEETPAAGSGFVNVPKIGVQFSGVYDGDLRNGSGEIIGQGDCYAVRFVAAANVNQTALDNESITAVWTRGVSTNEGDAVKPLATGDSYRSTVAYESLKNGETLTNASSEGNDYTHYLVYTMYDIPVANADCYIAAYLTLSDGAHTVKSKAVAARVGGNNAFSFAADKAAGYFIQGKINGVPNQMLNLDDDLTDLEDHAEKRDVALQEDDEFGCFYYNPGVSFKFFGYEMNIEDTTCDYYLEKDSSNDYMKLRANCTYTLTMSSSDRFAISDPVNPTVTLYFHPGTNWRNGSPKYSIWYNSSWHNFTSASDVGTDMYKLENYPFKTYYSELVFVRFNPSDANPKWNPDGNVWDQSGDQTYPDVDRPNKKVANIYDEDYANARVSWTVLGA